MKNAFWMGGLALAASLATSPANAEPMAARETARVLDKARGSIGLLSPSAMGLGGKWEISTWIAPWLLRSPNVGLRKELGYIGRDVVITGDYGLSVPTGAMRTTQGYLFPMWATSGERPGWVLTPSVGVWISGGSRGVWTGRIETTFGVPLGKNPATALDAYAPIELAFAPATTGLRARAGLAYDYALLDWLRARAAVNGYMIGRSPYPPKSPFYVSAEVGLELGLGSVFRVALGAAWYNYDQREKVLEKGDDGRWTRAPVRSNDFYPTLDLILRPR